VRVIAGSVGGRTFAAPPGRDTRPTAERVREALFSSLAPRLPEARVLDLYAGSGALGIEALSRGARFADFVESDRRAAAVVRANLEALGLTEASRVHEMAAERFCADPRGGPFTVVLCDPPYAIRIPDVHQRLAELRAAGALATGAAVIIERGKRDAELDAAPPGFLASVRRRSYGDTVLLVLDVLEGSSP
jgi:16S rRNA (guanine966-N2)-methyltransferase